MPSLDTRYEVKFWASQILSFVSYVYLGVLLWHYAHWSVALAVCGLMAHQFLDDLIAAADKRVAYYEELWKDLP